MKLQSLANLALNNNQMEATKGGKREVVTMTAAQLKLVQDAIARVGGTTSTGATGVNCNQTKTTMVTSHTGTGICVEWKSVA